MTTTWRTRIGLIVAIAVGVIGLGWSGGLAQDATPVAVQGSPAALLSRVLVSLREGNCGDPTGAEVASAELALRSPAAMDSGTPPSGSAAIAGGVATLAVPFADLLARPHVVTVSQPGPGGESRVGCGEIAGLAGDGGVAVSLAGEEGSAPAGVAWLGASAEETTSLALVLLGGGASPCPPGRGGTPVTGSLSPDLVFDVQAAASGVELEVEVAVESLDIDLNSSVLDLDLLLDGLDLRLGLASDVLCLDADLITGLPLLPGGTPAATPAPETG